MPPNFEATLLSELPVLYRVARRLTLQESDAEDLVSQTILQAHKLWPTFDGQFPRSWLIRVMRNDWLNHVRKSKVRASVAITDVSEPSDNEFWCPIDRNLDHEEVLGAIDQLPEDFRIVLCLCDIEEMTYDEAAETLMIPVGTVRSRLFRARRILRSQLVHLDPHPQ